MKGMLSRGDKCIGEGIGVYMRGYGYIRGERCVQEEIEMYPRGEQCIQEGRVVCTREYGCIHERIETYPRKDFISFLTSRKF